MAKRYDKEFRLGSSRLVVEQGYSQSEPARRLGVTATSIKAWIDQLRTTGKLRPAGEVALITEYSRGEPKLGLGERPPHESGSWPKHLEQMTGQTIEPLA